MIENDRIREYITLAQLGQLLPGHPHTATCRRWARRGISGVRLRTAMVGGTRCTTLADFEQFVAAVTAAKDDRTGREQDNWRRTQ